MSILGKVSNPITGEIEWDFEDEDHDYHQEIARSAFADMLHDTERNDKYYLALKKTIEKLHKNGIKANVLDIGTGSGILSMMAVKCGADKITACEAFQPMADCAEQIFKANGMKDKIHLIKKRSTDIKMGETSDCDMSERANVLVTELFDTELIGEGAIGIFNHAHQHLLTSDCIVIPDSASIYIQIVECPMAFSWNTAKIIANLDGEILLKTPESILSCKGEAALHDLQLSQLAPHNFKSLVEPFKIFDFDFTSSKIIPKCRSKTVKVRAISSGMLQVVFFWWSIKMDQDNEIILSCAPFWAHPDFTKLSKDNNIGLIQNVIPWRDHWMQAVYFLPESIMANKNQEIFFTANHDEYSFWFDVKESENREVVERYTCDCGFHLINSRTRIGQLNMSLRNKKYLRYLEEIINKDSVVLSLSEGSLLSLSIAALGCKSLICLETKQMSRDIIEAYKNTNKLKNVEIIQDLKEIENFESITHVFGEPHFHTSILPWDNFYFGTLLNKIKVKLNDNVKIIPFKANILAVAVEFVDLQKIRIPLLSYEDFDLKIFNKLINESTDLSDAKIEAQPLWEYPCRALGKPCKILTMKFTEFANKLNVSGCISLEEFGSCNGIALWVDWYLDESDSLKNCISTGPVETIEIGKFIKWETCVRQGVHLLPQSIEVDTTKKLNWKALFDPQNGAFKLNYDFT